jgi:hypothetical protein
MTSAENSAEIYIKKDDEVRMMKKDALKPPADEKRVEQAFRPASIPPQNLLAFRPRGHLSPQTLPFPR